MLELFYNSALNLSIYCYFDENLNGLCFRRRTNLTRKNDPSECQDPAFPYTTISEYLFTRLNYFSDLFRQKNQHRVVKIPPKEVTHNTTAATWKQILLIFDLLSRVLLIKSLDSIEGAV